MLAVRHDYSFVKYQLEQIIVTTCCDMHYIIGFSKALCEPSGRGKLVLGEHEHGPWNFRWGK